MIISRVTFRLKFGKAKEAIAIWKEIYEEAKTSPNPPQMRLMSDLSGTSYTLVHEIHLKSFLDINAMNFHWATSPKAQELYQKFIPLCDSADKEIYKIEAIA